MPLTETGLWIPKKTRKQEAKNWLHTASLTTVLSILISSTALYVSFRSFNMSSRAMVIGQRAYLSIADGQIEVIRSPDQYGRQAHSVSYRFTLQNLGNTPADVGPPNIKIYAPYIWEDETTVFERELDDIEKNYIRTKPASAPVQKNTSHKQPVTVAVKAKTSAPLYSRQVGPKTDVHLSFTSTWVMTPEAQKSLATSTGSIGLSFARAASPVTIVGQFVYRDVFSERHSIDWCWVEPFHGINPSECTDEDKRRIHQQEQQNPKLPYVQK